MEYVPSKEKAAEFWDRFEELVRNYGNLPGVNPLSDDEKRDAVSNESFIRGIHQNLTG